MLNPNEGGHMQYALLIYSSPDGWEQMTAEDQQQAMQDYMALGEDPRTQAGADLGEVSSATTIQVRDGETLTTDGPFAETKEQLGGFYLIQAENLDEALEFAARIPAARSGGKIEVRPVVEH
jgi:hypothetical protein